MAKIPALTQEGSAFKRIHPPDVLEVGAGIDTESGDLGLGSATGFVTVNIGQTLRTTGSGLIDLPNNGSARFKIEGVAVSANVTAANLGTLTAGPLANADALHTHVAGGAVPTSRTLTAGTGMTGGGDLTVDRTFNVNGNADGSIIANPDDIQVGVLATDAQHGLRGGGTQHALVVAAGAAGFISGADKSKLDGLPTSAVPTSRTLTAGAGLTGGGDLTADRTFDVGAGLGIIVSANDVAVDFALVGDITTIQGGDAAAAGVANRLARGDHKHAIAVAAPVAVDKSANAAGAAASFARSDHKHDVSTAAPGGIAFGVAAEGTATTIARSDHVHSLTAPTAPINVTKAAASAGTSANVAREDHKHDISTDVPNTVTFGSATEGTATTLARSDHNHALTAPGAPVDVTKAAASAGASANVARQDHKHDVSTAAPGTVTYASATEGTATSLARSDHVHAVSTPAAPVNVTKAAAAAGTATAFARDDHKHDVTTATPGTTTYAAAAEGTATSLARSDHTHAVTSPAAPVNVTKAAAAAGTATAFARDDHKHDVTTAAVVSIGSANAEGTATSLARSDHVHDGSPVDAQLMFGNDSVTATTTTRYLLPGYGESTARTGPVQYRVARAGTLKNMRVRQNTGAGNGNNIVYTLRKGGAAQTLTVTIASTANDASDTTHSVTVAANDLLDIEVTKGASVATSPSDIVLTMEFAA